MYIQELYVSTYVCMHMHAQHEPYYSPIKKTKAPRQGLSGYNKGRSKGDMCGFLGLAESVICFATSCVRLHIHHKHISIHIHTNM